MCLSRMEYTNIKEPVKERGEFRAYSAVGWRTQISENKEKR